MVSSVVMSWGCCQVSCTHRPTPSPRAAMQQLPLLLLGHDCVAPLPAAVLMNWTQFTKTHTQQPSLHYVPCPGACTDALVRAGKPCRVLALINDSVGVLTASCYFDQATEMGVILGTGTNACIVDKARMLGTGSRQQHQQQLRRSSTPQYQQQQRTTNPPLVVSNILAIHIHAFPNTYSLHYWPTQVSKLSKWRPKGVSGETRTAINTEWGCYGSNLLPRVKEDFELDAASGSQQGAPVSTCVCVCGMVCLGAFAPLHCTVS